MQSALSTDEQAAMIAALDSLCAKHVSPEYVAECDEQQRYPREALDALARAGWSALPVPEEFGGIAASAGDLAVVQSAIARHSLAVAQAYYSLWVIGAEAITRLGTGDQHTEWLPRIAAGQANIAFALTEPGSGSDASALQCRARMDNGDYVVNGSKVFITGAAVADIIITAVRTSSGQGAHEGISLLCIDPKVAGVTIRQLPKLGLKAIDLCEVFFSDVRVPQAALLGDLDDGWRALRPGLAKERLFLAAISTGAMRDVLERATRYAQERSAFGQPIGGFQMIAQKLVRIRVALDAADALVREAAALIDAGDERASTAASVAKLFATEAYVSATRDGVQVLGGYGFTDEYPLARHYRDAKFLEIGGGTSEIQTIIIARSMGLPI